MLLARFAEGPREVYNARTPAEVVSDGDLASEEAILALIASQRPDDSVLSEERGVIEGSSGLRWVIDPLDGSHNFIRGVPLWCVSVAVTDRDGTLVGVVNDPLHKECFLAVRSQGSTLNGKRLPLHPRLSDPAEMVLGGSFRRAISPAAARYVKLGQLISDFGSTRELVAGALELAWTAAGRIDVVYHESKIKTVDKAAGVLLCAEAGLAVHDLPAAADGKRNRLLACPPEMSDALLAQLD